LKDKLEILRQMDHAENKRAMLEGMRISRASYYRWAKVYSKKGQEGLKRRPRRVAVWNSLLEEEKLRVLKEALEHQHLSCRELALHITDSGTFSTSESSVYRILKSAGLIKPIEREPKAAKEYYRKTKRVNEQWQSDITYIKILGWGYYFLITVLDDYSRMIMGWKLATDMKGETISDVVEEALLFSGLDKAEPRPRLLSDNGSGYVGSALNDYLKTRGMKHIYASPYHPQTNGKVENYQGKAKGLYSLLVFTSPDEARRFFELFVSYYNHDRYHESIGNVTPADVYYGKRDEILGKRGELKEQTMIRRRARNQRGECATIEGLGVIRATKVDHPFWDYFGSLGEQEKHRLLEGKECTASKAYNIICN
jgi:putative transposase